MGLEYKPDIVKIKGVHTDGQAEDIGFPNLGLDDLFKNATVEKYNSDTFKSNLVYKDGDAYKSIEDNNHFSCMKDGYTEFDGDKPDSVYFKQGNSLRFYVTPSGDTWLDKLNISNALKKSGLGPYKLTITDSAANDSHIKVDDTYYLKGADNNNYTEQTPATYYLYDKLEVDWEDPYVAVYDDDFNETWKTSNGEPPVDGYFVYYSSTSNNVGYYGKATFENGQLKSGKISSGSSYRISSSDAEYDLSKIYILDNNKLTPITNPVQKPDVIYARKKENWLYPNTGYPSDYNAISDSDLNKVTVKEDTFPVYTEATLTQLQTVTHGKEQIYERTGKVLSYKYGESSTIHIPLVSDTDINNILTSCGLDSKGLESYVHLTNLTYNDKGE